MDTDAVARIIAQSNLHGIPDVPSLILTESLIDALANHFEAEDATLTCPHGGSRAGPEGALGVWRPEHSGHSCVRLFDRQAWVKLARGEE